MSDTCKNEEVEAGENKKVVKDMLRNQSEEPKAAVKAKRKSTVEKGLEAVFDKFKTAATEDFERYIMLVYVKSSCIIFANNFCLEWFFFKI